MSTTYVNTIDSLPLYAERAEKDAAGNTITTTYATKSEVTTGLASKEDSANKAQSINASSTTDFPSSKATADYVNSSVATNTAKFLGNFTLTDLSLNYPATDAQIETALDGYTFSPAPTNNDYVYVEIQDPQTPGVTDVVKRFKFDGTGWLYEYSLNNSSFTAAEIAAIDSGINSTKVTAYDTHVADTTIHVTSTDKTTWDGKQDAISDLQTIRTGAGLGATAVQPGDLATVATSGDYDDLLNKPDLSVYAESADLATVATTGAYSDLVGTPTIRNVPPVTSSDDNKVLKASYTGGVGSYSWEQESGGTVTDVEVDGVSVVSGGVASITMPTDLVPTVTSNDDAKVLKASYTGGVGSYSWEAESGGSVTDVEVDGTSVVNASGVAEITMPTVPALKALTAGNNITITEGANSVTIAATVDDVPAVTSSDDGKVLKATYSGGTGSYAWGADTDTTYTAGNMIAIDPNNSNAIGVSTTAGITDIQQVNALPANPVSTVLYLIPET